MTHKNAMMINFFISLIVTIFWSNECAGQLRSDVETGIVWTGYNDIRIPGDQDAEPLSLSEELTTDPAIFYRIQLDYTIKQRHDILLLVAPLRTRYSGSVSRDINYNDVLFAANQPLTVRYRFDSYRLRYAYTLYEAERLSISCGVTAKIRDASISFENNHMKSEYVDTGFVPLLYGRLRWDFHRYLGVFIEFDAAGSPQGRAEDVLLSMQLKPNERLTFKIGYRILEGGADNDKVYTFSLFHYAVCGLLYTF